ncbi:GntR family transcriptional regulator [Actinomadura sp. NBRC 104412]|uniref:FadR/GntR family transcriptional regulator n=1 Tax=Actinomadura sp. NBRC 104412 TaxID=3032203 RepID=UPI0024A44917|nr:FadR/GntR family transcriptional regulator [Actinomadura sp. NBRC 104412]GLZ07499.1 GntR family transcriptional regulator [Actinomadura sp. NBRC 104412]
MTKFAAKPVSRLRPQIEEQIREAIVSGQLSDGDRLPSESELAQQFGVARSTIREALRSLVAAGLIEKIPGATGGSFVRELNPGRFGRQLAEAMDLLVKVGSASRHELTQVREMLEVPSCRLAAEHRTDEDLARLHDIVETQKRRSVEDADVPDLDMDFHGAIAAASGNKILHAFVEALHSVTQPVQQIRLSATAGKRTVRQHLDVVKAIERRDPEAAEQAIRAHLDYLDRLEEPATRRRASARRSPRSG